MSIAFVLGNGLSRKGLDLGWLRQHGKIYGCNALYREFTPDVLVATDRPIATSIQESGYAQSNIFYTRRPMEGLGALPVPRAYFGYSSGPIATAISAIDGHRLIYLLGFDMGPVNTNQFNNIYAGTEFYKPNNSQPTFTGNWVKQLIRIAQDFPQVQFVRIHGATTAKIVQFDSVSNLKFIQLTDFVNQLSL
jgi:hypothetical protein